jgi:hypothetical protein
MTFESKKWMRFRDHAERIRKYGHAIVPPTPEKRKGPDRRRPGQTISHWSDQERRMNTSDRRAGPMTESTVKGMGGETITNDGTHYYKGGRKGTILGSVGNYWRVSFPIKSGKREDTELVMKPKHLHKEDLNEAAAPIPRHPHAAAIHHDAVKGFSDIHNIMRSKGYKLAATRKHSAGVSHWYEKGEGDKKKTFELDGWHGTGKWGPGKQVHALWHNHEPVHEFKGYSDEHLEKNSHNPTEGAVKAHRENIEKIKAHLSSLKEDVMDKDTVVILEYNCSGTVNGKGFKCKTPDVYDHETIRKQNPHLDVDEAKAVAKHTYTKNFEDGNTGTTRHGKHRVTTTTNAGHFGEDIQERAMDTEHGAGLSMHAGASSSPKFALRHKKTKQVLRTMSPQQARSHMKMMHADHELVREGTEEVITNILDLAEVRVEKAGALWQYQVVLEDEVLVSGKMVTENGAWAVGDRYLATFQAEAGRDYKKELKSIKDVAVAA